MTDTASRTRANAAALVLATAASLFFALAPIYSIKHELYTLRGETAVPYGARTTRETIAEMNGPSVYAVLAVPVVITALPLLFWSEERRRRWRRPLGWTLLAFSAISLLSIGFLYLPASAALLYSGRRAMSA